MEPLEIHLGDIVRLRKPHPCGGYEWEIVRVGADIGLRCCRCGRRVLLPYRAFRRRVKMVIPRSDSTNAPFLSSQGPPRG